SQRALAQLAEQKPREKILLGRGRARKKLREQARSFGGRAFTLGLREACERLVDVREREPGSARGCRGARAFQRRVADADPTLARVAAEIRHPQRDFRRIESSQAFRERVDFRKAAARPRNALGGGEQFGEQHERLNSKDLFSEIGDRRGSPGNCYTKNIMTVSDYFPSLFPRSS